jgi:hypothetical protein
MHGGLQLPALAPEKWRKDGALGEPIIKQK